MLLTLSQKNAIVIDAVSTCKVPTSVLVQSASTHDEVHKLFSPAFLSNLLTLVEYFALQLSQVSPVKTVTSILNQGKHLDHVSEHALCQAILQGGRKDFQQIDYFHVFV